MPLKRRNFALKIVQQFCPSVTSLVDAKHPLSIRIIESDADPKAQKDHATCAVAQACKRAFNADAAIIGTRSAYMVLGTQAFRYRIPASVCNQIKAFDRGKGFNPGIYTLAVPVQGEKLGHIPTGRRSNTGKTKKAPSFHTTRDVRAVLGTASKTVTQKNVIDAALQAYKKALKGEEAHVR